MAWLKQHFVEALKGNDLADRAHMSASTFRQHFRALTGWFTPSIDPTSARSSMNVPLSAS